MFKNLTLPAAHDPYHRHAVVPYLNCLTEYHIKFFEYMSNTGYDEYVTRTFLSNKIAEFGKKLLKDISAHESIDDPNRNYTVAPKLTHDDIMSIVWKWEGNLMEIIAGNVLSQIPGLLSNRYVFDKMCGDEQNDFGVDGWVHHQSNKKFRIGVQVKFRKEKEVHWNDQISKCVAITESEVRKYYTQGEMTDAEWCSWGKDVSRRAILITSTALHTSVNQAVGDFMFEVIDAEDLLQNIGKKNNTNPHKEFWDNCLTSVKQ